MQRARDLLSRSTRIVALTGAGVSAESGVPTFRGTGGLWRSYRPEDLATPMAFARDPRLVWEWYDWRRGIIANAQPNAAHRSLARLENTRRLVLVTQNVDGLHHLAGSHDVILLHGDIWSLRCTGCNEVRYDRTVPLPELPPRCVCGALLRPDVVWFGEALPAQALERAHRETAAADVLLVVGTSAVVWPAAGLIAAAIASGTPVIEVNLEATDYSNHVLSLRGKAAEIVPALLEDSTFKDART